jgi:hypothetical protein
MISVRIQDGDGDGDGDEADFLELECVFIQHLTSAHPGHELSSEVVNLKAPRESFRHVQQFLFEFPREFEFPPGVSLRDFVRGDDEIAVLEGL